MIGIYKIISPSNKIYIGQSINIKRRFYDYSILRNCKRQTKLYNSFLKYGVDAHIFDIIEECDIARLNIRERYWQEFYNVLSTEGLNCLLVKTNTLPRVVSEETRKKIGEKSKGRIPSEETRQKRIKSMTGLKRSNEFCQKMSIIAKNRTVSLDTRNKQRFNNLGKKHSQITKDKVSKANYQKEYTLLLNTDTGIYYNSICEVARTMEIECWKLGYILNNPKSKIKLKNIIYV